MRLGAAPYPVDKRRLAGDGMIRSSSTGSGTRTPNGPTHRHVEEVKRFSQDLKTDSFVLDDGMGSGAASEVMSARGGTNPDEGLPLGYNLNIT